MFASTPPSFTILIPTYNQAHYLPACLKSLLAQTCSNWEAVIVNDGSTDSTRDVLGQYASRDNRFRVLHKENGGVATALNLALANARGKWICWLSSDDLFEADKLETHVRAFATNPGIYFFRTNYSVYYEATGQLSGIEYPAGFMPPDELQVLKFFELNYVSGISVAIHRSVFEQVGGFNTSLRNGQDFDMWLRISAKYHSHYIDQRTCITRLHPGQGSSISADIGIFDSARAGLYFLNTHHFEELFPLLDLTVPEHGLLAVQSVLKILVNPLSYINCCGFGGALLGRMHEWIGQHHQHLSFLHTPLFSAVVSDIAESAYTFNLKSAFKQLHVDLSRPYMYQTQDPLTLLEQHACFLESEHGRENETRSLQQYLEKFSI